MCAQSSEIRAHLPLAVTSVRRAPLVLRRGKGAAMGRRTGRATIWLLLLGAANAAAEPQPARALDALAEVVAPRWDAAATCRRAVSARYASELARAASEDLDPGLL